MAVKAKISATTAARPVTSGIRFAKPGKIVMIIGDAIRHAKGDNKQHRAKPLEV
jgi:hypothetical protein